MYFEGYNPSFGVKVKMHCSSQSYLLCPFSASFFVVVLKCVLFGVVSDQVSGCI